MSYWQIWEGDKCELEGEKIKTAGDLMECVTKIETKEEAQKFMEEYKKENKYAEQNIGYLSGYYGYETRKKIQDLFNVSHPVFGSS